MCFFSCWGFFFNEIISQVAGRSTECLFFFSLPPSPTPPASVGLVPTLTQGLNSTEKLKKKNEVTSWFENFNFIKALFPILWRRTIHTCRTASRGKFHWQSISGQDWTKGKNTWSLEMGKLQDRKTLSHLPDTDAQGCSGFSFKCLVFFLCVGRTGRYSWEANSDPPPLISESLHAREGGFRYSPSAGVVTSKTAPAQLDRCTDLKTTIPCSSGQGEANLRPNTRQPPQQQFELVLLCARCLQF